MHSITKKNMLQLKLWQKKKLKKIKFVGFVSMCICLCLSAFEWYRIPPAFNISTSPDTKEMEKDFVRH